MTEVDIMAIDCGWNTRNTEIPSPGEAALASIRLEREEWKGTGQKLALEKGEGYHFFNLVFIKEARLDFL